MPGTAQDRGGRHSGAGPACREPLCLGRAPGVAGGLCRALDANCHQRPVLGPNALDPEVLEATTGIEPVYTDLQSAA
jgi:hypothetical protein